MASATLHIWYQKYATRSLLTNSFFIFSVVHKSDLVWSIFMQQQREEEKSHFSLQKITAKTKIRQTHTHKIREKWRVSNAHDNFWLTVYFVWLIQRMHLKPHHKCECAQNIIHRLPYLVDGLWTYFSILVQFVTATEMSWETIICNVMFSNAELSTPFDRRKKV